MTRTYRGRRYGSRRRGLTPAQQAAHDKAYAECDHTIRGRYAKGDVVAERNGQAWKVVTYGIAYHEDCSDRIYGVQPVRGPKGWRQTVELRAAIEHVRSEGIQEPGSRAANGPGQERPDSAALAKWQDGRPDSLASFPVLTVYEGGLIGVWCPNYDDSPTVAWIHDVKLATRLKRAIGACPSPVLLPETTVRAKTVRVRIAPDHERYAAYAAAVGATPHDDWIEVPSSEYRRIRAELDQANEHSQDQE